MPHFSSTMIIPASQIYCTGGYQLQVLRITDRSEMMRDMKGYEEKRREGSRPLSLSVSVSLSLCLFSLSLIFSFFPVSLSSLLFSSVFLSLSSLSLSPLSQPNGFGGTGGRVGDTRLIQY